MRGGKWARTSVLLVLAVGLLVAFNLSYLSSSGLLIWNLRGAQRVTHATASQHAGHVAHAPLQAALSRFSMERFMSDASAADVAGRVRALVDKWQRRNAAMHTLGTASYLDGASTTSYEKLARQSQPLLREHFSDLLEDVLTYFRARSPGTLVEFRDRAALPGFHIFDCNKLFSLPVASVHKDMQWNRLRYSADEDIDTDNTLSFTLAIALPPGGAGLYTFDDVWVPPGALQLLVPRALCLSAAKKTLIQYKEGYMVTHNGQTSHMIAPSPAHIGGHRITLQGHGVYDRRANTWWLYW